ncbi:MAG: 4-alpha-glucanotransferase [Candidatus Omnitrophota bacterium]|nr:4-alpha-glucanotransferase [Candidatus Omnitrophota bacterium]
MKELLNTLSKDRWRRIGTRKRAGVLVPLFSVYSANSVGIGDMDDLKLLVDWCEKTGNSILQLLPMNEISSTFCPYDAISSFALEPSYISLTKIPASQNKFIKNKISDIKERFRARALAHVDYGIKEAKEKALRQVYAAEEGRFPAEFKKFMDDNRYWIDDFALFKVLKSHHGGRPWYEWEGIYRDRNSECVRSFEKERNEEALFHKWVQWIAASQFEEAKAYAGAKGILIKGDLPILISRDSADVWARQGLFHLEFSAGAPPDMYCAKGQRWGVPTYNWEAIAEDDYRYLKEKLGFAQKFYDILRVDHAAGLFRIWSIPNNDPAENEGLRGAFDPSDENKWEEHGRLILTVMVENTDMLLCAEDLGTIPKACPETLKEFGMPGNDVQRWMKDWKESHDFLSPEEYRLAAVSMLSTHDTTNWSAWWENEAGTVDEAVFIEKTLNRGINYASVQGRLFAAGSSRHGRLRWLGSVDSAEKLVEILGKPKDEIADFVEMYENSYGEKEKLWEHLNMKGAMSEKSGCALAANMLKANLKTKSIFCINLLIDYLYLTEIFKGDPYKNRINRPGTVKKTNWSLVVPVGLEELLRHKVCGKIREMISASGRGM